MSKCHVKRQCLGKCEGHCSLRGKLWTTRRGSGQSAEPRFEDGSHLPGRTILVSYLLQLIISADFVYYYAKAMMSGKAMMSRSARLIFDDFSMKID